MCFQNGMVALGVVEGNNFLVLLVNLFGCLPDEESDLFFAKTVLGLDLASGLGMVGRGKDTPSAFDLQALPQGLGDPGSCLCPRAIWASGQGVSCLCRQPSGQLWKGRSKRE